MNLRSSILTTIVTLSALMLTGCTGIMDDLQPCPTGLYVHFKYDYNIQRADMFNDHCNSVTLYVFDSNEKLVRTVTEENNTKGGNTPLKSHDFSICIPDLPSGNYHLIALANQKPLAETLTGNGAKYRRSTLSTGDDMKKLEVILDREGNEEPYSINSAAPMDTLWHAMRPTPLYYDATKEVHDTLSLVRDTKMLTIGLHQLDEPTNIDIADFDIYIIDNNRWLNYDNSIHEDDNICYTPFYKWNTNTVDTDGTEIDKTAHASLTFNRLMSYTDLSKDAILYIVNKKLDKVVAQINLPEMLSQGRNAPAYMRYGVQEYLDREYDYHLDFFLTEGGGTWEYASVRVSVLSWAYRIQNVKLK